MKGKKAEGGEVGICRLVCFLWMRLCVNIRLESHLARRASYKGEERKFGGCRDELLGLADWRQFWASPGFTTR